MANGGTLRQQIREMGRDKFGDSDAVDLKQAAARDAAELRANAEFCARFLDEFLEPTVYAVYAKMLTSDRRLAVRQMRKLVTADIAAVLANGDEAPWAKWLEYDPESSQHIALFELTKEQALAAAQYRRQRIGPDLRRIGLLELAAGRCKPGQKIGEVWTEEGLADIERRLIIGKNKFSLGPVGSNMERTILDVMREQKKEVA